LKVFDRFLKKFSNIKFHKNPSSMSRVFPCGEADRPTDGQMDRHDKTNNRLSQFCKHV